MRRIVCAYVVRRSCHQIPSVFESHRIHWSGRILISDKDRDKDIVRNKHVKDTLRFIARYDMRFRYISE